MHLTGSEQSTAGQASINPYLERLSYGDAVLILLSLTQSTSQTIVVKDKRGGLEGVRIVTSIAAQEVGYI